MKICAMKKHSSKNTYSDTDGRRYTRAQIESRISIAKQAVINVQLIEYGYNYCTICKRNDCLPLDCAHTVPVKDCLERGYSELAWDTKNISIIGRKCHREMDKNNIQRGSVTDRL